MTSIGERIYDLRNRNNMSQGNLADKLDVSRQTISKWENNMCLPEAEKLLQLSEIFGVSTDYILKGRTITEPEPVYIYVKDPDSETNSKYNESVVRKYVGIVLAVAGGLLTLWVSRKRILLYIAIFGIAPTLLGILFAKNSKHPWLFLSWFFYAVYTLHWLGSGLTLLFALLPYSYRNITNIEHISDISPLLISYSLWIFLAVLILCTIKAKRGYIFKKKQ